MHRHRRRSQGFAPARAPRHPGSGIGGVNGYVSTWICRFMNPVLAQETVVRPLFSIDF